MPHSLLLTPESAPAMRILRGHSCPPVQALGLLTAWLALVVSCLLLAPTSSLVVLGRGGGAAGKSNSALVQHKQGTARLSALTMSGGVGGDGTGGKRPLVTLKLAVDTQGAVDDRSAAPQRFTSPESLDAVHRLRRDSGAVVVGVETVVRDNPSLTVRRVPLGEGQGQPLRVVLDRNLRLPEQCQVLSDGNPTWVLFTNTPGTYVKARAAELMLSVLGLPVIIDDVPTDTPEEGCPLDGVLSLLSSRGVDHVMVEGGPTIARAFLSASLVDRAIIIRAPVTFSQPVPSGIDAGVLEAAGLRLLGTTQWGTDAVECWARPEAGEWPGGGVGQWP